MVKDKKLNNARKVAAGLGLLGLFGAIVLVLLVPNILEWGQQRFNPSETLSYSVPFTYSKGFGSGLTIHKIWAQNTGKEIEFRFDYTSDVDRGMSFFNPPEGEILSIQKNLSAGTGSVLIVTSISALQKVSNITVNFYIPASE
jgi:hypothetical protein